MLPGSRSSSKSILSLVLIGVVLCAAPLILYKERLRRVWSLRSSFAQPKYHVQGPPGKNLGEATKSIIAASLKDENTSWIHDNFGADWDLKIYVNDDPQAPLTIPRNKGRESTTYLTYILDHYEDLPDYIVFIHSQRYQWHNEDPMYDGVQVIKNLRLLHVEEEGFCSLRCTHAVGCPKNLHPDPDALHAYDPLAPMLDSNRLYADVFRVLLPNHPLPQVVGASCCSQFALTRAKVLERPKEDYELYRQFLLDTEIDGRHTGTFTFTSPSIRWVMIITWNAHLADSGTTGRVFEYLWHSMSPHLFALLTNAIFAHSSCYQ